MSKNNQPWVIGDNGQIEYRLLTSQYLKQALDVMRLAFFTHENVCRAIDLQNDPVGIEELEELCIRAANDGVSVIAIDKSCDRVIGAAFNKIQVATGDDAPFFEKFANNCKSPKARYVTEFMLKADSLCDVFALTQCDCLLEVMFLGTLPECRRQGVGKRLIQISMEVVEKLKAGNNVKQSLGNQLDLEPIPKVVTAICTSFITQRIVRDLGFVKAVESSFDMFEYNGRKFGEFIEKQTPTFTIDYKKL